ncbi:MAG: glutamine--tRNA ligase/YqeY domain fusion protein [Planctomycetia bacterium]|nr:MAG: glutamine--tRNA ligase/YqeY domain fusion protein [Planctomycetia bacterium]
MSESDRPRHFIQQIIDEDNRTGKWGAWPDGRPRVHTRFPPEPNGYLHVGHAKSIFLNYGLAEEFGGRFNLRFDDTNPTKEDQEFVDSIIRDVRWLGARWPGMRDDDPSAGVLYASDYFQQMYDWAVELIRKGRAFVCDQTAAQIREFRGTLTAPGRPSPWRDRPIDESLDLFERMRDGEFPDGTRTLRAKIDMASPNLNLRDPVMYRIVHATHHRQGDRWCVYPMYDWAHGLEDSIEGITHSICTLEFEIHRPLYDWFIRAINDGRTEDGSGPWGRRIHHPQQIEFARLSLNYTVMSKRKLLLLVKRGLVSGWDDPRMPTLSAMRRRGYPPESLRELCARAGVAKFKGTTEIQLLEHCVRDHLNRVAPRAMGVLRPVRVLIENWGEHGPADRVEWLDAVNNPEDPAAGSRRVPFSGELFIDQDDFAETPPPKFWRLFPGNEVRLRYAYLIRCTGVEKDAAGRITALRCTYDPATRGGDAPDGRKVKSTLHWVSARHALTAEVRLYEHLFNTPDPEASDDDVPDAEGTPAAAADAARAEAWLARLNPNSLTTIDDARVEPMLADAAIGAVYQLERLGYFCVDSDSGAPASSAAGDRRLVLNRTVSLKDSWGKQQSKG